jgi:hypothetical protein
LHIAIGDEHEESDLSDRCAGTENVVFFLVSTAYLNSHRTTPSQSQTIVRECEPGQSATCQPESPAIKGETQMKSTRTPIAICLLFTTATLFAQTTPSQQLMKVNVPFSFGVENQSLPAGEYLVLTVTPERSIRIASVDGKHSAIVNTLPNYAGSPSENSRLVFHKYGNEYFLTQVWTAGQNVARNPLSSKRAMEVAGSGGKPDTRTIIALADHR